MKEMEIETSGREGSENGRERKGEEEVKRNREPVRGNSPMR